MESMLTTILLKKWMVYLLSWREYISNLSIFTLQICKWLPLLKKYSHFYHLILSSQHLRNNEVNTIILIEQMRKSQRG